MADFDIAQQHASAVLCSRCLVLINACRSAQKERPLGKLPSVQKEMLGNRGSCAFFYCDTNFEVGGTVGAFLGLQKLACKLWAIATS